MSNKKIAIFFIICLALFAGFVLPAMALSEEFSVEYQKPQIDACSCGMTADSYTIRNTGDVTSTYQLFKSGSAAQYSTLSQNFFSLDPGQSRDIINYINLPCSALGIYDEAINITTTFGDSKAFEQKISAGKCANFDITPVESLQSTLPCSPVKYDIAIRNTGSYDEIFDINVSEYSDYASVSESSVLLGSNENRTISVYYNLPCSIHGDKDLGVNIKTERSKFAATVPLKLKIIDRYDFDVNANSKFTVCEGEGLSSIIDVANRAGFGNSYLLGTDQKFARIDNNSITLPPNTTGSTNMVVDASNLRAGNYSFNIVCTSDRGSVQKQIPAVLDVERCRDFAFKIIAPKTTMIASREYNYEIDIENYGTKNGNFNINVEGPEWLSLAANRTILAPGEIGKVLLRANIPADFEGNTYARVTVTEDFVSDSQRIAISAKPVEEAYMAGIKVLANSVKYDFSDINVSIENNGVETATYQLSLDGPEWMSLPQRTVTLAPGETAILPIRTSPTNETPEGKYNSAITATVNEAGIGYSSSFSVKLYSAPWYTKAYYLIAPYFIAYWLYIVIVLAALFVLVLLALLLKKLAKGMKDRKKLRQEMQASKVVIAPEPVIPKYQARFQPFATPAIIPEQVPKIYVPEFREKKQINWARFFSVIFLLIVIGGVIALAALNWGSISGWVSNVENQTAQQPTANAPSNSLAPELEINRSTGVEGEGNVVYIRGDGVLDIPVTIKNKAPAKVVYTINNVNASWISTDKHILALDINGSETMHLFVNTTPDLPDGTYQISLGLNINEQDLKYSEKIELRIDRTRPEFEKYLPYIIAGIAVALVLIILMALTRRSRFDVRKEKPDVRIVRVREKGSSGIFGKIIMIVIIIAIVVATAYYVSNLPKEQNAQYDQSLDLSSTANQTIEINLGMNDRVIIPFVFSNGFPGSASYHIDSSADWISATDSGFSLASGDVNYVNITASPDRSAPEGLYNATIRVSINSENIEYAKTIVFQLKDRSLGKTLLENKFFVIGVAIVIIGILLLASFKRKKQEKREFLAEIKQEIAIEKEKRSLPKTAIKFKPVSKKRK